MFTVYILLSEKDNKRYIGFTHNLERRLTEHNSGKVKSTKNRIPLKVAPALYFSNVSDCSLLLLNGKLVMILSIPFDSARSRGGNTSIV